MCNMRKKRYNVILNPSLVSLIDSQADSEGMSRSMLLSKAAWMYLRDRTTQVDSAEGNADIEGQERLW